MDLMLLKPERIIFATNLVHTEDVLKRNHSLTLNFRELY